MEAGSRNTSTAWVWAGWLVIALLWLLPAGWRALAGPDEGRYAEIAREMWASRDFVTPHLNGFVYFEKPPLQYWLNALCVGLFGPTEFAVRLYNVLAGLGCAGLAALVGARLWGRRTGVRAGFASVAMLWPLVMSAILTLDMGLTLWLFAGVGSFLLSRADPVVAARPRWMLATWAALGLAMLSKGLVALVLPAGTLLAYALVMGWRRSGAAFRQLRWGPGLLLFAVIVGPWFWLAAARNPGFLNFFFVHEHFQRFATDTARRPGPWWYFLPLVFAGTLPLATLLGPSWRQSWRGTEPASAGVEATARQDRMVTAPTAAGAGAFAPERFLWLWVACVVLFFSVSRSKLPAYILPIFPALGLLLGHRLAELPPRRVGRHLAGQAIVWLGLALAGGVVLGRLAQGREPGLGLRFSAHLPRALVETAGPWLVASFGAWGLGLASAAWLAGRRRLTAALATVALSTALMGALLQTGYGRVAHLTSARDLALALRETLPPQAPVYSVDVYEQGLPFYLGRPVRLVQYTDEFAYGQALAPRAWLPDVDAFVAEWRQLPAGGAVMRPALFADLRARGVPLCEVARDPGHVAAIRCVDADADAGSAAAVPGARPPLASPVR